MKSCRFPEIPKSGACLVDDGEGRRKQARPFNLLAFFPDFQMKPAMTPGR